MEENASEPGPSRLLSFEHGDARNLSAILKEPIDVTISSPPYWGLKDYGVQGQIGQEETYDGYLSILVRVFNDIYDQTKDTGSLWLVLDAFKQGGDLKLFPFDLAGRLAQLTKWRLTDVIIWNKKKNLPWSSRGNLRHNHEFIMFFAKSSKYKFYLDRIREPAKLKEWWHDYPERYNPNGKSPSDIWDMMIPTQGWGKPYLNHFCPFPPRLVERIVQLTTNKTDLVFDPFGGSGIVLAVASVMGRRAFGVEINDEYIRRFHERVLPDIRKMWADRRALLLMTERTRVKLRNGITTLRQIKFAKMLGKKIVKKGEISQPAFMISHVGKYRRTYKNEKPIASKLTLVYEESSKKPSVDSVLDLCKEPPLKSFGILPKFEVVSNSELSGLKGRLWIYGNGSLSRTNGSINISDSKWRSALERMEGVVTRPLLLANKRVDVPNLDKQLKELEKCDQGWSTSDAE
ncbi:MAG: hypothetical protein AUI33_10805 [Ignavibacteria bacterium 13_1_40CM_2_61_4]|nr:MAG: hypothetical protein AUI33_10805 [Ignavibacteria bacterium 13_1_40CM_2_61_4]